MLVAIVSAVITFTALDERGFCQESAGTTGEGVPVAPAAAERPTGFIVQDGIVYFVRNNRVNPVNSALIPQGQVMTATGRLESEKVTTNGFSLDNGVLYFANGGPRQRVDTGMIPAGRIMTLKGELVAMGMGTIGFPGARSITVPSRASSSDQ